MECFSPISILPKNSDNQAERQVVPCGRCAACLSNRRSEWVTRLQFELRNSYSAHFVTLTYQEPPYGEYGLPSLCKEDVQLFMKRLRKRTSNKIKYYLSGEYGDNTFRPHYHMIVFNLPDDPLKMLVESWNNGIVHIGDVTERSISYCLKYIMQSKRDSTLYDYVQKPFALMSKGLGANYIESRRLWHKADILRNYVVKENGSKARLPRYFRDKLYTKSEKQKQRLKHEEKTILESLRRESPSFFKNEIEQKVDYEDRLNRTLKRNSKL